MTFAPGSSSRRALGFGLFGVGSLLVLAAFNAAPGLVAPATPGGEPSFRTHAMDLPVGFGLTPIPASRTYTEPSIEVAPDGTIYVTAIQGFVSKSPVWRSTDGGLTFSKINTGATGAGAAAGGGDADIEVDERGRIFHVDLWVGSDSISVSEDGKTWIGQPLSHYVGAGDRQWLMHYRDQYLYIVYNQVPSGIFLGKALIGTEVGAAGGLVFVQETLVQNDILVRSCICPAGAPAVDQADETIYVPWSAATALWVSVSTNGGLDFRPVKVPGTTGESSNLFPVAAVDTAGNAYLAWSERKGGVYDVYLSRSVDKGASWGDPIKVTANAPGTHVMPWLVAGDAGRVSLAWYGTETVGHPERVPAETEWRVYFAQSIDALAPSPTFTVAPVSEVTHRGDVSVSGLFGDADRSLGDFLQIDLDPQGFTHIAYTNDAASEGTGLRYARQVSGEPLYSTSTAAAEPLDETGELPIPAPASARRPVGLV